MPIPQPTQNAQGKSLEDLVNILDANNLKFEQEQQISKRNLIEEFNIKSNFTFPMPQSTLSAQVSLLRT